VLPPGLRGAPGGYPIGRGADLFISVWNLHRRGARAAPRRVARVTRITLECALAGH